jgi:hypothetical protein
MNTMTLTPRQTAGRRQPTRSYPQTMKRLGITAAAIEAYIAFRKEMLSQPDWLLHTSPNDIFQGHLCSDIEHEIYARELERLYYDYQSKHAKAALQLKAAKLAPDHDEADRLQGHVYQLDFWNEVLPNEIRTVRSWLSINQPQPN